MNARQNNFQHYRLVDEPPAFKFSSACASTEVQGTLGLPDLETEGSKGLSTISGTGTDTESISASSGCFLPEEEVPGEQFRQTKASKKDLALEASHVVGKKGIKITDFIGQGATSQVFFAEGPQGWVVVKMMIVGSSNPEELELLTKMKHPNIVQVFEMIQGPPLCYVLEYCMGGDLFRTLHARKKGKHALLALGYRNQVSIARDVSSAIAYIHDHGMIHRDIKSPNILLEEPILHENVIAVAKLTDFGSLIKRSQEFNTAGVGTVRWMSPDVRIETYGSSADVYSFGILLWEILSRKIPFADQKSDHRLFLRICMEDLRPDIEECYLKMPLCVSSSSTILELIPKCWTKDASSRPSMKEVHAILCAHLEDVDNMSRSNQNDDKEQFDESQGVVLEISKTNFAPPLQELRESCGSGGLSKQSTVSCACFHGLFSFLKRSEA